MPRNLITCMLMLSAAAFLAACQPDTVESVVPPEQRIEQRWAYLIEHDFASAWEMHSPGFKEMTPLSVFMVDMARRPIRVLEAELISVECEGEVCDARINLTYQVTTGPTGVSRMRVPTEIEERWILHDGQWWYLRG